MSGYGGGSGGTSSYGSIARRHSISRTLWVRPLSLRVCVRVCGCVRGGGTLISDARSC